jgi:hypothetical protein
VPRRRTDGPAARCLDLVAREAASRLQQTVVRAPPRDAAFGWKAASVHPLQPLETGYQALVRDVARTVRDPERRRDLESAAMADFFVFDGSPPRLLGPAAACNAEPLPSDRLAEARRRLKAAAAELERPPGGRADGPPLRRHLHEAYRELLAVLRACCALPGSRDWGVAPVTGAERLLAAAGPRIDGLATAPEAALVLRELYEAAELLAEAVEGVASVQMFYAIESFALFRLLLRYRLEGDRAISPAAARAASAELTTIVATGHAWLNDWLRDCIVELAARIARADPSGNTLFFLKGGRALAYLQGVPEEGRNDWDTQIVINPDLPPAAWYDLFLRVSNEVLRALEEFKLRFYMLLTRHSADFERELSAPLQRPGAEPGGGAGNPDGLPDPLEAEDPPAAGGGQKRRANCKAELIDVGLPRYDTVEAREQWKQLSAPGAILTAGDRTPFPGHLYFVEEYVAMLREVFAGNSPSPDKAAPRIERLYAIFQLPGTAAVIAEQRARIPETLAASLALIDQVPDTPTRSAHTVLLRQFADAYRLAAEPELAEAFDRAYARTFAEFFIDQPPRPIAYPAALRQAIETLTRANKWRPVYTALADAIGFAQFISVGMEAHLRARGAFMMGPEQRELIDPLLRQVAALFPPEEEREVQLAGGGAFAALLQGGYLFFPHLNELDPVATFQLGVYSSRADADPATMLEPLKDALVQYLAVEQPPLKLDQATPASPIRISFEQPQTIEPFSYRPLAIEIAAVPPPERPLLSYVWDYPLLTLRGLVAQYRTRAAATDEYGRRGVLLRTAADLVDMLTTAENPEPANAALAALRDNRCRHLTVAAPASAGSDQGRYPASYYPDSAFEVTLTSPEAIRGHLAILDPPAARRLDLLVVGRGCGGRRRFAGWSAEDLAENLVQPLAASGVSANFIVLDFALSASLVGTFAPLAAPGGRMLCSLYGGDEALMTTRTWSQVRPALGSGDLDLLEARIHQRAVAVTRAVTGAANLERVRSGDSEQQIAARLARFPSDRDAISIARYLPWIARALAAGPGADPARVHAALLAAKANPNLGFAEQKILQSVPGPRTAFSPDMRKEVEAAFADRLRSILKDPQYRLQLPVNDLPVFAPEDSLWSLVKRHRCELLALALSLPRCPSPYGLWLQPDGSLAIDTELKRSPLSQETQLMISKSGRGTAAEVAAILTAIIDGGAVSILKPHPNYLQQ